MREFHELPDGWSIDRLTDHIDVIAGQSPPSATYNDKGDGMPFLQGCTEFGDEIPITKIWCTAPNKIAPSNSTLMSVRAPVGELNRADQDYAIGRGLAALVAKEMNPDFLYYGLHRWRQSFQRLGQGSTFEAITARQLKQVIVAAPTEPDEQRRIAAVLKLADDAIAKAKAELEATRELKRSLIVRLLTIGKNNSNKIAETKFGPVPSHWEIKSLVEHAGAPNCVKTGPFGAQLPPESFDKSGMQFVNITDIGEGVLDFSEIVYIKDFEAERLADYQLKSGDLVFSRVASVGRVALIPESMGPLMMSSNCIRLRISNAFDPNFLCLLFLSSPFIKRQVVAMSTGGSRPIVTPRFLRRLSIARPPIEEQQEISEIVDMASANETKKIEVVEALQQIKKSLLHNLLTGKIRIPEGAIHE